MQLFDMSSRRKSSNSNNFKGLFRSKSATVAKVAISKVAPVREERNDKTRNKRRHSYQPTTKVVLVLSDEQTGRGKDKRHASLPALPNSTSPRPDPTRRSTGRSQSDSWLRPKQATTGHTSQQLRLYGPRATSSTSAKRDLPPVPSSKSTKASQVSSSSKPPKPTNRSRYSKVLPLTPVDTTPTPSFSTRHALTISDRSKVDNGASKKNDVNRRLKRNTLPSLPEDGATQNKESDSSGGSLDTLEESDDGHDSEARPRREGPSLMKRLVESRTRRFSFYRRSSKRDSDATIGSRFRPRLPRLTISGGRAHGIPSATTASIYSVVIQPGSPMPSRSPVAETPKRLQSQTTHVTEDGMPERIKRILKGRGGDLGGLSRSHASSSPVHEESYHSDLTLTLGTLRTDDQGDWRGALFGGQQRQRA